MTRTALAGLRAPSVMSSTKVSTLVPVAASALAIDSVDGQRARPSGVMRLERLKVVGSRPERLARPDAERPERAARRSRAVQICEWVNMEGHNPCFTSETFILATSACHASSRRNCVRGAGEARINNDPTTSRMNEGRRARQGGFLTRWVLTFETGSKAGSLDA